jgi:hypothetical protein
MSFFLGWFGERIDDVAEDVQRFVDVAAFAKSFSFYVGVFDPFAACEIDYVQFGLFGCYGILISALAFDKDRENGMGSWAFGVHGGGGHLSGLLALEEHSDGLLVGVDFKFEESLDEDALLGIFSYLMDAFVGAELLAERGTRSNICSL